MTKPANNNRTSVSDLTKDMSPMGALLFGMMVENQRARQDWEESERETRQSTTSGSMGL